MTKVPNPGNLPDPIHARDFDDFEIITQANIHSVIEQVENGEREPLNHVAIPYTSYLEMALWMKSVEQYIIVAGEKLRRWQREYRESLEQK